MCGRLLIHHCLDDREYEGAVVIDCATWTDDVASREHIHVAWQPTRDHKLLRAHPVKTPSAYGSYERWLYWRSQNSHITEAVSGVATHVCEEDGSLEREKTKRSRSAGTHAMTEGSCAFQGDIVGASDTGHEAQDGLECPRRSTEDVAKRHNRDTKAPHTHLYPVAELRSRRCRIPVITHGPTCRRYPLFKMIWSEGSLLLPI